MEAGAASLPVLIVLRGLAKPDGGRLVWDIVSDGPSVIVNGLDLSQLTGGGKPKAKPPGAQPGQPVLVGRGWAAV